MTYLVMQIVLCLLLAAGFGFIIGWALSSIACRHKMAELEASGAHRLAAASSSNPPMQSDDL